MVPKRMLDCSTAVVGLYLFASPSILGFAAAGGSATRVAWLLGLTIAVFAGFAAYLPRVWEAEALNIFLGPYLAASPWAWSYADQANPATNAVVVGLLVTGLAIWALLEDTTIQKWWHERHLTR
jgi:hypothetical protein